MSLLPGMNISVRENAAKLLGGRSCVVCILMVLQNGPTAPLHKLLSHEDLSIIYFLHISKLCSGRYILSYFSVGVKVFQKINVFD